MSDRPKIRINPKKNAPRHEKPVVPDPPKKEVSDQNRLTEKIPQQQIKDIPGTPEKQAERKPEPKVQSEQRTVASFWKWIALGESFLIALFFLAFFLLGSDDPAADNDIVSVENAIENEGIEKSPFENESLSREVDILGETTDLKRYILNLGVPPIDADNLYSSSIRHGISRLRSGDRVTAFVNEETEDIEYLVVDPQLDPYTYYRMDLTGDLKITKQKKKLELKKKTIGVIVKNTLGMTFVDYGLNLKIISDVEAIFAWSVDFFDIKAGDRLKVIYEEEYLDGQPYQIKDIVGVKIVKNKKEYYAFKYNTLNKSEFYDDYGVNLKRSFLSSPIKYGGVITSGYGLRTHPVSGDVKKHLGTDYAAPEGTEIQSVADGVVTKASFTSGNGYFVKLRHDQIYETQYLHMMEMPPDNIRPGRKVRQGQIIGYVGSTGKSTGPHVCYRFWKNGQQVDPMEENLSKAQSIDPRSLTEYLDFSEKLKAELAKISYL